MDFGSGKTKIMKCCQSLKLPNTLTCILIGVLFLSFIKVNGQCADPQYDILLDLYENTDGNNWPITWPGNSVCDVCTWVGVECDGQGKIISLDLSRRNLNGLIPQSISGLTSLKRLEIDNNPNLQNPPSAVFNLSSLEHLDLSMNNFNGSLPGEIENLSNLQYLDIGYSGYSGQLPASIGNLASLKELYIYGNSFSGQLPTSIGNLSSLEILEIVGTSFSGSLPSTIGDLSNLTILRLFVNGFTGNIPTNITNLSSLITLDIAVEGFSGLIPTNIGNLSQLQHFYIQSTSVSGTIPASIGNLSQLVDIYLNNNQLNGNIPTSIGTPPNLFEVLLNNNSLSGGLPTSITQNQNIERLEVRNNSLDQALPDNFLSPKLELLNLSNNNIPGNLPVSMGDNSNLIALFLNNNNLEGTIPESFSGLTSLSNVNLSNNSLQGCITGEAMNTFCNASNVNIENNCFYATFQEMCGGACSPELIQTTGSFSVCSGDAITLQASSSDYSYDWSTGENGNEITLSPTASVTVTLNASNANGCIVSEEVNIEVFETEESFINETVCAGQSITIGTETFSATGTYTSMLQTINGCDSIINLELEVMDIEQVSVQESICFSESIEVYGRGFSATGIYTFEAQDDLGCIINVILGLTNYDTYSTLLDTTVCSGADIFLFGQTYNGAGTYSMNFQTVNGCDSTVSYLVSYDDPIITEINYMVCYGESVGLGNVEYNSTGVYEHIFTSETGCDSTVVLDLLVLDPEMTSVSESICPGGSVTYGGQTFMAAGEYDIEVGDDMGCVSVLHLTISESEIDNVSIYDTICQGGEYDFNGTMLASTGQYESILTNNNNCDSIISLFLEIEPAIETTIEATICEGEEYMIGSNAISTTGTHVYMLTSITGCDSIVNVDLQVFSDNETIDVVLCEGESYTLGGMTFSTAGDYDVDIETDQGCIVSTTLSLNITAALSSQEQYEICDETSINIGGIEYAQAGSYSQTYVASTGCDSTVYIEIMNYELAPFQIEGNSMICAGTSAELRVGNFISYEWSTGESLFAITITDAGTYNVTVTNENGCTLEASHSVESIDITSTLASSVSAPSNCNPMGGIIEVLPSAGVSLYSIDQGNTWQQSSTFDLLPAGSYELLVATADTSCVHVVEETIVLIETTTISYQGAVVENNTSCVASDGRIELLFESTTASLEYSIDGGNSWQSSPIFESVIAGEYIASARDITEGCSVTIEQPIYVSNFTTIDYVLGLEPLTCSGDNNASLSIDLSGNIQDIQLSWEDGSTSPIRENLSSGNYAALLMNIFGCVQYVEITIDDPDPVDLLAELPSDTTLCNGDTIALLITDETLDYTLYQNGVYLNSGTDFTLVTAGQYILEGMDVSGCVAYDTTTVNVSAEDFSGVDFLVSQEGLVNEPIVIIDVSWPLAEESQWIIDDENIVILENIENQIILEFLAEGTYPISMRSRIGDCYQTITKTITVVNNPNQLNNPDTYLTRVEGISDVLLYPNPNAGQFNIKIALTSEQPVLIILIDQIGNVIEEKTLKGDNLYIYEVDISNLPPGVYATIIQSERDVRYNTFTKQ